MSLRAQKSAPKDSPREQRKFRLVIAMLKNQHVTTTAQFSPAQDG